MSSYITVHIPTYSYIFVHVHKSLDIFLHVLTYSDIFIDLHANSYIFVYFHMFLDVHIHRYSSNLIHTHRPSCVLHAYSGCVVVIWCVWMLVVEFVWVSPTLDTNGRWQDCCYEISMCFTFHMLCHAVSPRTSSNSTVSRNEGKSGPQNARMSRQRWI